MYVYLCLRSHLDVAAVILGLSSVLERKERHGRRNTFLRGYLKTSSFSLEGWREKPNAAFDAGLGLEEHSFRLLLA